MRFGLFYEHQLPRAPGERDEGRLLADALEQVELADRLGHRLRVGGRAPLPRGVLALERPGGLPRRRQPAHEPHPPGPRDRPGPPGRQPPGAGGRAGGDARPDLRRPGRVRHRRGELADGAGSVRRGSRVEKRAQWEESLDAITRMFVEEPFAGYEGRWISMPPRNVVPKPRQRPHPPLWVACSRRETILTAAQRGLGALSFAFVEPEAAKEWVDSYYELIASDRCVPAGFAVNPNVAVVLPLMCHRDEATAIERGIDGAHFFGFSLAYYYAFGEHRPGRSNLWREFEDRRAEVGFAREIVTPDDGPLGVRLLQEGLGSLRGAIGTPDQVADLIERYEAVRRRPGHLRLTGRRKPSRAHLREPGAVRRRGPAPVRRAGRRARARQGRAPRGRGGAGAGAPRAARGRRIRTMSSGPTASRRPPTRTCAGRAETAPPSAGSRRRASWPRARERRPSRRWFAVAATSSSTASSTVGPGWR